MSLIALDYTGQLLEAIKTQTDKFTFDASNYLYVNVAAGSISISETKIWDGTDYLEVNTDGSINTVSKITDGTDTLAVNSDGSINVAGDQSLPFKQVGATDARLDVYASYVENPSNLDVALSTRASETTLSSIDGKFPAAAALSDALSNPTTTLVGSAILGWDGTNWRRISVDTSSRLLTVVESLPSLPAGTNTIGSVLGDYASSTTINGTVDTTGVTGTAVDVRKRGGKLVFMENSQDVSVTVTIEGSYDGTTWFTIRDNISLASDDKKVGILTDRYGYVRATAVASATPTTGSVVITVSSMTF